MYAVVTAVPLQGGRSICLRKRLSELACTTVKLSRHWAILSLPGNKAESWVRRPRNELVLSAPLNAES